MLRWSLSEKNEPSKVDDDRASRSREAAGADVVCFGRRPGRDWGVARRLAAAARERGVEVMHAHQYTPFFYSALAKPLCAFRPRLILTEHGRHYPDRVSPLK